MKEEMSPVRSIVSILADGWHLIRSPSNPRRSALPAARRSERNSFGVDKARYVKGGGSRKQFGSDNKDDRRRCESTAIYHTLSPVFYTILGSWDTHCSPTIHLKPRPHHQRKALQCAVMLPDVPFTNMVPRALTAAGCFGRCGQAVPTQQAKQTAIDQAAQDAGED